MEEKRPYSEPREMVLDPQMAISQDNRQNRNNCPFADLFEQTMTLSGPHGIETTPAEMPKSFVEVAHLDSSKRVAHIVELASPCLPLEDLVRTQATGQQE